jgi:hypothetical protein
MKRSFLPQSKRTKCRTKCSCHHTITVPKSTTTCCPNKPNKTRPETQSVPHTKWSTSQ